MTTAKHKTWVPKACAVSESWNTPTTAAKLTPQVWGKAIDQYNKTSKVNSGRSQLAQEGNGTTVKTSAIKTVAQMAKKAFMVKS